MIRDLCTTIYHNKNLLMLISVGFYILALFGTFANCSVFIGAIVTLLLSFFAFKNFFPIKIILIWCFIFYFGIINTSLRIKETDELVNIAPINATIYGQIFSIPQNKGENNTKFFFKVNKIEYDGITKTFDDEKVLVSLDSNENFKIYDSYKIRGRLSLPFKAGNPSQFDYGNYLRNFNTYAVFYGRNPYSMHNLDIPCYEKINSKLTKTEKILQEINNYRENILSVHAKYLNSPNLEILGGIVFGDDAVTPPEDIKQSFINSGLLHILAASGMNVAFIYSFFFLILRFFRVPFKVNIGLCIFTVLTYVFMTGLGASVVRAALMLLFVLIGKLIDRDANSISLLSFVAFLMLLYNPMYINDVGFQLSFVVTFGLLIMTPYILKSKNRILNWIIGTISIPIVAQLWVIPIQIYYFNNISAYSIFANIMSVPILSVISFSGFVSSLLSIIQPIANFICYWFDYILNPLITLIVNISDFWGKLPHASVQTTHPSLIQIIIYYLILLNLVAFWDKNIREKFIKYLKCTLPSLIVILILSMISLPNHNLEITAFDVGNADAFLIKTPNNKYIMIDTAKNGYNGGKSQAEMLILKYFKDRGIKKLDSIVITHFDNDHCGGALDLINGMNVNKIYVNSTNHPSKSAQEIYKAAKNRNTQIIEAESNQIVFDDKIKLTNYIANDTAGIGDNESSIISLLSYGDFSMLFTGDAGVGTLNKLQSCIPKDITVLKVGHHGASGVINKKLSDYINPKYSIISTGENKFGHPSPYTIGILKNSNILRTDIDNSIKIVVNKNDYQVYKYNNIKKKYE